MNWFWKNTKVGIYNMKDLREHLGLDNKDFNKLMELEVARYRNMLVRNYSKSYYDAKMAENPQIAKTGGTPTFKPHPANTSSYIFNEESGVFLEKTWSNKNKYNSDGGLPFNFIFKP